ncbi:MAG: Anti-sigma-factor antagonist [uncultured bacterium]|nr:MAG: Anti-sigma-factor antagonist [uncultured bacterium]
MFKLSKKNNFIECKSSSNVSSVERIQTEFSAYVLEQDENIIETSLSFVLRELLMNAIEHGNGSDIKKAFICKLERLSATRYALTVSDEGNGFDTDKVLNMPPADPANPRNRGYSIINAYSDEVLFSNRGSKITAFISLTKKMSFIVEDRANHRRITPSGDLNASVADLFRKSLLEWVECPLNELTIDFVNVKSIDSIGLSVLVSLYHTLKHRSLERSVAIIHSNKDIQSLFNLTRLNRIFKVVSSGE